MKVTRFRFALLLLLLLRSLPCSLECMVSLFGYRCIYEYFPCEKEDMFWIYRYFEVKNTRRSIQNKQAAHLRCLTIPDHKTERVKIRLRAKNK